MKGLQQDVVKLMGATLTVAVLVVMVQNAGGVAEVARAVFGGWNATLATLIGRPAERV